MLKALCPFCMTIISRRGSWAVLVVQNLQFKLHHMSMQYARVFPDMQHILCNIRIGRNHSDVLQQLTELSILYQRHCIFNMKLKNCQNSPGWLLGSSWARSWDALGVSPGVLGRPCDTPVGHVTTVPACYKRPGTLQDPLRLYVFRQVCCTLLLVRSCVSLPRFRTCLACLTLLLGVSFRCCKELQLMLR